MADAQVFWVGIFTSLWVALFFGFSGYQIRKTYSVGASKAATSVRRARG